MSNATRDEQGYLLVQDNRGWRAGRLTDADHQQWLDGSLEVFSFATDGRLFELATCDPFVYPGCWEWAPV